MTKFFGPCAGLGLALLSISCVEQVGSRPAVDLNDGVKTFTFVMDQAEQLEAKLGRDFGIHSVRTGGFEFKVRDLMAYVRQLEIVDRVLSELRAECDPQTRQGCDRYAEVEGKIRSLRIVAGDRAEALFFRRSKTVVLSIDESSIPSVARGEIFGIRYMYNSRNGRVDTVAEARAFSEIYFDVISERDLQKALLVDRIARPLLGVKNFRERHADELIVTGEDGIASFRKLHTALTERERFLESYGVEGFSSGDLSFDEAHVLAYVEQLDLVVFAIRKLEALAPGRRAKIAMKRISVRATGISQSLRMVQDPEGDWELQMMMDWDILSVNPLEELAMLSLRVMDGVIPVEGFGLAEAEADMTFDSVSVEDALKFLYEGSPAPVRLAADGSEE